MKIVCSLSSFSLTLGGKSLFEQTGFTMNQGDHIGLLGLNGHGKSSLFKILTEEIKPDTSIPPVHFDKSRNFTTPEGQLDILNIPQEIAPELLQSLTIEDLFWHTYPLFAKARQENDMDALEHLGTWNVLQRFESYLNQLDVPDLKRALSELSGGEQKKVLLSLGLSAPQKILLWDEPTNHLDLQTLNFLEEELASSSKTFMIVSHDRTFLAKVTNKILSIQQRKLHSFQGSYADYLTHLSELEKNRRHLLSRLQNTLRRETEWMRQGIKARGTRSKKRVENYEDLRLKVNQIKEAARRKLEMSLDGSQRKTKILFEAKELTYHYDSAAPLWHPLNFKLWKEDKVGLIGANGVGKSTLLKLLLGELSPTSGTLKKAHDLVIAYFSQNREELDPEMTPAQYLAEGNSTVTLANGSELHIHSYLERFLFQRSDAHRPLSHFSGGEKNRLQLAKHLLKKADVWIFDEPTNDLDLETLEILEQTLAESPHALILISHDRSFLAEVTNKTWLLESSGLEVFEGGYEQAEEYLESRQLEQELNRTVPEKKVNRPAPAPAAPKISREELEKQIRTYEEVIEKISQSLSKIEQEGDFSPEKTKTYGELRDRLSELEEKLLELYERQD